MSQRFYRLRDVIGDRSKGIPGLIPISKASWYSGIADGRFPKPVKLSEKSSAWRSDDIDALIERLNDGRWDKQVEG